MARFETWSEVARLFFGAACVGVLLILLLTAEAKKIEEKEEALVAEPENEKVICPSSCVYTHTHMHMYRFALFTFQLPTVTLPQTEREVKEQSSPPQ